MNERIKVIQIIKGTTTYAETGLCPATRVVHYFHTMTSAVRWINRPWTSGVAFVVDVEPYPSH